VDREQLSRVLIGAAAGAGIAFLFLTERGRLMLQEVEPRLDELITDLQRLRSAAIRTRNAVDENRRSIEAAVSLAK
jgi:hypothetical protein